MAIGDGVAPRLQHELRPEVLPAVDILEAIPVRPVVRIVAGPADVVRDRPAHLARGVAAGCDDRDDRRIVDRDRRQKIADAAQLQLGIQLEQRKRSVEVDIDSVVERVVHALEQGEPAGVIRIGQGAADFARLPERAPVDEEVQLVEQRGPVPVRPVRVVEDRPLPRLDGRAPRRGLGERVHGELPGTAPGPAPVARVALPPASAGLELDHRQVPRQCEPDRAALAGLQRRGHRDGSARRPGRGGIGSGRRGRVETAVGGEIGPCVDVGDRVERGAG